MTTPTPETPTPKTDALIRDLYRTEGGYSLVFADFARTLERENARLVAELATLKLRFAAFESGASDFRAQIAVKDAALAESKAECERMAVQENLSSVRDEQRDGEISHLRAKLTQAEAELAALREAIKEVEGQTSATMLKMQATNAAMRADKERLIALLRRVPSDPIQATGFSAIEIINELAAIDSVRKGEQP